MSETRDYLATCVYPALDAVSAGLLDGLNPSRSASGKYYVLDCPSCGEDGRRRAYYYPSESAAIYCSRKNKCEIGRLSIWDHVQQTHKLSNRDTFEKLCTAAGVPPPHSSRGSVDKQKVSLNRVFFDVVREALVASGAAMEYLRKDRGMTEAEITEARIGYYPSEAYVRDRLKAAGCDLKQAEEWEILDKPAERTHRATKKLAKRIVGYWEQPDGSIRPWGRVFGESARPIIGVGGEQVEPNKYEFSLGMVKTVPYRFRDVHRKGVVIAVEGPLDAERMAVNGLPAVAIGGANVILDQAKYLVSRGVNSLIHLTDGDKAGYEGGLSTIKNCEPLGISTYIATIPEGKDDPDALLSKEGAEPLLAILDAALSGGAYLARDMLHARLRHGLETSRTVQERLIQRERLTPLSRIEFDQYLKSQNVALPPNQSLALRLAAELLAAGLGMDDVNRIVRDRYGVVISVAAPEVKNG